jgi:outer membrane lipoprotein-sorting protein
MTSRNILPRGKGIPAVTARGGFYCARAKNILAVLLTAMAWLVMTTSRVSAVAGTVARKELLATLSTLSSVKAVESAFICEKKLQVLRNPFFSRGNIIIARPDRVRFETLSPYRSCYILNGRKIYMRNESNSHWRTGTVDSRPVIGIIMRQFAAWSLGNSRMASADFHITLAQALRPMPSSSHAAGNSHTVVRAKQNVALSLYTLRPRRGVLKAAIREIQLGFTPLADSEKSANHALRFRLTFIRIVARNGDQTLFWLRDTRINPRLRSDCFAPVGPA